MDREKVVRSGPIEDGSLVGFGGSPGATRVCVFRLFFGEAQFLCSCFVGEAQFLSSFFVGEGFLFSFRVKQPREEADSFFSPWKSTGHLRKNEGWNS